MAISLIHVTTMYTQLNDSKHLSHYELIAVIISIKAMP